MLKRSLVLVVAALLIGGCSGSDPEPKTEATTSAPAQVTRTEESAGAPAPSHDDFLRELNAICRGANAELSKVNTKAQGADTRGEIASAFEEAGAIYEDSINEVEALEVPPADKSAFDRYLRSTKRSSGLVRRLANALFDRKDLSSLNEALDTTQRERLEAAQDLEADDCGQSVE